MDAMGCQKEICRQLTEQNAGYAIAVKGNQPALKKAVEEHFANAPSNNSFETYESRETSRGRQELRRYFWSAIPDSIKDLNWPGLETVGHVRATRIVGDEASYEDRYYILKGISSVEEFARAVRSHWHIENSCHWVLDVVMMEDDCQVREKKADRNLATVRRIALNKIKKLQGKRSFKQKMMMCALNDDYRIKALETLA